jgi:hypothetical protein
MDTLHKIFYSEAKPRERERNQMNQNQSLCLFVDYFVMVNQITAFLAALLG